jgi:hypothetical protein
MQMSICLNFKMTVSFVLGCFNLSFGKSFDLKQYIESQEKPPF